MISLATVMFLSHLLVNKHVAGEASGCPSIMKTLGSSCYLKVSKIATWYDANEDCNTYGGHLAIVSSARVNTFLFDTFIKRDAKRPFHWIGLHKGGNTWRLPTFKKVKYFNWNPGEPNNRGGNQECVAMMRNNKWGDTSCHYKKPYICEVKKDTVLRSLRSLKKMLNDQSLDARGKNRTAAWLLVGTYHLPGRSCADIRQHYKGYMVNDGEYWVEIDKKGPMKVYCDMTTNDGGWTLVTNLILDSPRGFNWSLSTDYRDISDYKSNRIGLSTYALKVLRGQMAFKQVRFFCHMKISGSVFDIATELNPLGENVIDFFTTRSDVRPKACGSFVRLSTDTSDMSQDCSNWGSLGKNTWQLNPGYARWHRREDRLFLIPIDGRSSTKHWSWRVSHSDKGEWYCDLQNTPKSVGDSWKIFVR